MNKVDQKVLEKMLTQTSELWSNELIKPCIFCMNLSECNYGE